MRKTITRPFEGSHFHHMYLNGDNEYGMFIPVSLHKSVYHNGKTGQGMKEINKAALLWLCEQSSIKEIRFDANNKSINMERITLDSTVIEEARKIGKKLFGNSTTDDKTFWTLVLEYQKSAAEKEILQKQKQEVTQELTDYMMDFNMCILEKEQLRKELEEYKKQQEE